MPHSSPLPRIQLAHGSGGKLTLQLIRDLFAAKLSNPHLNPLGDAALMTLERPTATGDGKREQQPLEGSRVALTTDGFVVHPLVFSGGNIGHLAINGTVNDLAVSGAYPRYLTLAAVLEEGLDYPLLQTVVSSIAEAATAAGVLVVAGDTKVVERGKGDGIFLTTTGLGLMRPGYPRTDRSLQPGDVLIVSGPLGDHGAVILAARSNFELKGTLQSDCAAVTPLVDKLFENNIRPLFMRDPTRGGLAGVLCDLAEETGHQLIVEESQIPLQPDVMTICDIFGVDPLHLACEGRIVAVAAAEDAERLLQAWQTMPAGRQAARIGELTRGTAGRVTLKTSYGGQRLVSRPSAELLPRIC
jgi:hydrogenase expression/formation protein HypE